MSTREVRKSIRTNERNMHHTKTKSWEIKKWKPQAFWLKSRRQSAVINYNNIATTNKQLEKRNSAWVVSTLHFFRQQISGTLLYLLNKLSMTKIGFSLKMKVIFACDLWTREIVWHYAIWVFEDSWWSTIWWSFHSKSSNMNKITYMTWSFEKKFVWGKNSLLGRMRQEGVKRKVGHKDARFKCSFEFEYVWTKEC